MCSTPEIRKAEGENSFLVVYYDAAASKQFHRPGPHFSACLDGMSIDV